MTVLITRGGDSPDEWERKRDQLIVRLNEMSSDELRSYLVARPSAVPRIRQMLADVSIDERDPHLLTFLEENG